MAETLPKFKNPPVIETVLGVLFKPIVGWQISHFGLFWSRVRDQYPGYFTQPALPDDIEQFGSPQEQITLSFGLPQFRSWFVSPKDDWLVQVQNTRFISNWRKREGDYPHYEGFSNTFYAGWSHFLAFLKEENLPEPEISQVEVSYVNHIDVGADYGQLDEIFPTWSRSKKGNVLDKPEAVAINAVYAIPEERGRLYIIAQPVVRHSDMTNVVQLTLTAKVLVASNDDAKVREALEAGHEWVVSGFADFTTPKMHEVWQRQQ